MGRKAKKFYSREFKTEAVKLITEQGYKIVDAAERLGVSKSVLSKWRRELITCGTPEAAFPGKGYLKPDEAEVRALRNELEKVKRERDILKKAMAYFAAPPR